MVRLLEKKCISLPEVKKLLEDTGTKFSEDEWYKQYVYTYTSKFSKVDYTTAKTIAEKLREEFPDLNDKHLAQIINIMPETIDDLRTLFAKERFNFSTEQLEKMLEIIERCKEESQS